MLNVAAGQVIAESYLEGAALIWARVWACSPVDTASDLASNRGIHVIGDKAAAFRPEIVLRNIDKKKKRVAIISFVSRDWGRAGKGERLGRDRVAQPWSLERAGMEELLRWCCPALLRKCVDIVIEETAEYRQSASAARMIYDFQTLRYERGS